MPKTAAAVLGFALVTGSIGFNTVRYPVVWKMVGSVDPSKPASRSPPAVVAPQPAVSESSSPFATEASEPMPTTAADHDAESIETKQESTPTPKSKPADDSMPTRQPADKATALPPAAADAGETSPNPSATTGSEDDQEPTVEEPRKPLVPVLPVSVSNDVGGGNGVWSGVVRLPPVEHQGLGSNDYDTSRLFSGMLPKYPRTETP